MSTHPDLHEIFRCNDQSALLHNYVTSEDPPAGAWSHHSAPQSPLGRTCFPEVLTVARGDVYTRSGEGQLCEHMLLDHEWLPWHFRGRGEALAVQRVVARDIWAGRVSLHDKGRGLLLLECAPNPILDVAMTRSERRLQWQWRDFTAWLTWTGATSVQLSDDPASLKRRFAGFDDVKFNDAHMDWVLKYQHRVWLGLVFEGEVEVRLCVARGESCTAPARLGESIHDLAAVERERWSSFFDERVPALKTTSPAVRDTYYFAWQMLWSNRCDGGTPLLPQPFTSPTRLHYGSQWWWDSVFHAAAYRHLKDGRVAYDELANFWPAQTQDGALIGCLHFLSKGELRDTGAHQVLNMQPPVIGFVSQLLRDNLGWPQPLEPYYRALLRHAEWNLSAERDTDGDGLSEFFHCFETGTDQSSRWDHFKLADVTIAALKPAEAVDLNVWMSELWRSLAMMARELGDESAAAQHEAQARRTFASIEELMWHEGDGIYYDIDAVSHQQNRVKSNAAFMPLLSPYAKAERVNRLINAHLLNPTEFWPAFPVPSIALDEPTFDPRDMWRGPSWINFNWMIAEGLHRQGRDDVAADLSRKVVELVGPHYEGDRRTRSPRLWEWYHPVTGEPLGNHQYSWSALVVDLILRFLEG